MKKYFLNFLILFSALTVFGQEFRGNPLIREGDNTFINNELPKELRLKLINCLSQDISSEDKVLCLLQLGQQYQSEGEHFLGIICYKSALQFSNWEANKTYKSTSYQLLGYSYQVIEELDTSIFYFQKALKVSKASLDSAEISSIYNNIAMSYSLKGDFSESLNSFKNAAKIFEELGDREQYAGGLHNIGVIYKRIHFDEEAQKVLFTAIDIFDELGLNGKMASSYNTLGNIFIKNKQFDQALKYHRIALELRRAEGEDWGIAGSLNNLGRTYQDMGILDSALYYYGKSLNIKRKIGNGRYMTSTLDNIGDIHLLQGEFISAKDFYKESYTYRQENQDSVGLLVSDINLARVLVKTARYDVAEEALIRSEKFAQKQEALKELRTIYELLTELYQNRNEHGSAFMYSELLRNISDTLLNADKQRAVMELEARFDVRQKQKEINYLKQIEEEKDEQLKLQIAFNTALIVGMIILLGLLVLIYRLFVNKNLLSKKNETLLRDMHHRVKNNLQVLSSLFSLQLGKLEDGEAKEALVDSENRVRAMNLLHQQLYSKPKTVTISLQEYVTEMVEEIKISYHKWSSQSNLVYQVEPIELDADAGVSLGLILTELLSNCYKHVVPNTSNAEMNLSIYKDDSSQIVLKISDNGPGYYWEESSKKSFGLRLVKLQVKQLNGDISQVSPNELIIRIPPK
ncbi:tetratricopeptide repeat protein [bacterium SCSIO 12741]|nr:tetratricopeptide repeat protein [bacterium SCSIO 12741]